MILVGIDSVEIERIKTSLKNPRFLNSPALYSARPSAMPSISMPAKASAIAAYFLHVSFSRSSILERITDTMQ